MFAGMAFRLLFDIGLHVDPSDLRLTYFPRFSEENFPNILKVVDIITGIAETHRATPGTGRACLAAYTRW